MAEFPKSKFIRIKCEECGSEQNIFSSPTSEVKCNSCGGVLAKPTGGKAKLVGKAVKVLS